MNGPDAVVFDMDGTLLDTERLARACFLQACADFDWPVDESVYDRCVGTTWQETERIMRTSFGPSYPYEAIDARWSEHYHAYVDHQAVDMKPGIPDLLVHLADQGVPMAVATSSRRPTVVKKLQMAQIDHYFEFLICGGETARGKPHADPYLAALDGLGASAGSCWALEDSDNGVRAALAAGLVVFQIPDELPPSQEVIGFGHTILPSALDLLDKLL